VRVFSADRAFEVGYQNSGVDICRPDQLAEGWHHTHALHLDHMKDCVSVLDGPEDPQDRRKDCVSVVDGPEDLLDRTKDCVSVVDGPEDPDDEKLWTLPAKCRRSTEVDDRSASDGLEPEEVPVVLVE